GQSRTSTTRPPELPPEAAGCRCCARTQKNRGQHTRSSIVTTRQLKLGAVLMGVGGPGQHATWLSPEIPGNASVDINWYIERARQAEAAKFDLVFIVDSQFITPDSPHHYLNRLQQLPLLAAPAART